MPRLKVSTAKVPQWLAQRARATAERLGVPLSELVRRALTEYLERGPLSSRGGEGHWWTGTGDLGATYNPVTKSRTMKTHPCVEALGALDEAAAAIALARSLAAEKGLGSTERLLAAAEEAAWRLLAWLGSGGARADCVQGLAARLGEAAAGAGVGHGFRVNGATVAAATAALARTLARRAERALVECVYGSRSRPVGWMDALAAANRLSSLLYVAQVLADREAGAEAPAPPCSQPGNGGGERRVRV